MRDLNILIPVVAILAWAAITIMRIREGSRRREFAHRERLAMIERGLVPSPDKDPEQFERMMRWQAEPGYRGRQRGLRIAGTIVLFVGLGLTWMIYLSDRQWDDAVGVGGMIVMVGVGLLVASTFGTPPSASPLPPGPVSSRPNEPQ
jgi:hypothetical protein